MDDPEDFEERGVALLRSRLPERTASLSDEELSERIRSAVPRCVAYDLIGEEEILLFVHAGLLLGEEFDSGPDGEWAAEVLQDSEMTAGERAAMVAAIGDALVEEGVGDGGSV